MKIKFKKLSDKAVIPKYKTPGSSGMDLVYAGDFTTILLPQDRCLFNTGLAIEIPKGYEAQIRPRSGLALHMGITVLNTPGTIDSDYRGEIGVILINLATDTVSIEPGTRIAQLVIVPIVQAEIEVVEELSDTKRGKNGFGSTGA